MLELLFNEYLKPILDLERLTKLIEQYKEKSHKLNEDYDSDTDIVLIKMQENLQQLDKIKSDSNNKIKQIFEYCEKKNIEPVPDSILKLIVEPIPNDPSKKQLKELSNQEKDLLKLETSKLMKKQGFSINNLKLIKKWQDFLLSEPNPRYSEAKDLYEKKMNNFNKKEVCPDWIKNVDETFCLSEIDKIFIELSDIETMLTEKNFQKAKEVQQKCEELLENYKRYAEVDISSIITKEKSQNLNEKPKNLNYFINSIQLVKKSLQLAQKYLDDTKSFIKETQRVESKFIEPMVQKDIQDANLKQDIKSTSSTTSDTQSSSNLTVTESIDDKVEIHDSDESRKEVVESDSSDDSESDDNERRNQILENISDLDEEELNIDLDLEDEVDDDYKSDELEKEEEKNEGSELMDKDWNKIEKDEKNKTNRKKIYEVDLIKELLDPNGEDPVSIDEINSIWKMELGEKIDNISKEEYVQFYQKIEKEFFSESDDDETTDLDDKVDDDDTYDELKKHVEKNEDSELMDKDWDKIEKDEKNKTNRKKIYEVDLIKELLDPNGEDPVSIDEINSIWKMELGEKIDNISKEEYVQFYQKIEKEFFSESDDDETTDLDEQLNKQGGGYNKNIRFINNRVRKYKI